MSEDAAPTSSAGHARGDPPPWIEQVKWIVATLAIPFALAWVAHEFSERQARRDAGDREAADVRSLRDGRFKTYTELLNKREEADMNVRKEIFSTLLGNYFDRTGGDKSRAAGSAADLTRRMTVLELLASNFDESLNLSPLFWQVERELGIMGEAEQAAIRERLSQLASAVKRRQIDALAASGGEQSGVIPLDDPEAMGRPLFREPVRFQREVIVGKPRERGCTFEVTPLEWDPKGHRIYALIKTEPLREPAAPGDSCLTDTGEPRQWSFWVDEFDFPLISYTRLSTTERFAIVISSYDARQAKATVSVVYFPSSRSGARDRPFLDTVVDTLNTTLDTGAAPAAARAASR